VPNHSRDSSREVELIMSPDWSSASKLREPRFATDSAFSPEIPTE
jgi:hypothetical protein